MNEPELRNFLENHRDACVRDLGGHRCWTLLASGEFAQLAAWGHEAFPEWFDARGDTQRVRLWIAAHHSLSEEIGVLVAAVQAAERHDVTLQLLCVGQVDETTRQSHDLGGGARVSVAEHAETYPVLHLARHRKGWFPSGVAPAEEVSLHQ